LEAGNHGISLKEPDQAVARSYRGVIQATSVKELSKDVRQNHAIFAICIQVSATEPQKKIYPNM